MIDVVMPQMGESIVEGTLTKWLKKAGERVERDEPLFEISTDKVDTEIPSPSAGTLAEILVEEGKTVGINTVVARIDEKGEATAAPRRSLPAAAAAPTARRSLSRPARRCAAVRGADRGAPSGAFRQRRGIARPALPAGAEDRPRVQHRLAPGQGHRRRRPHHQAGPGGPTWRRRRPRPAAPAPAPPPLRWRRARISGTRVEPMSVMRSRIAEHMVLSKRTSAHVTTVHRIDMTKVARIRERNKEQVKQTHGFSLTFLPFVTRAASEALRAYPIVNASIDGTNIVYHDEINIGIAVALEGGLIVPVIRRADEMNVLGLQRAIVDLSTRARARQLKPDEVHGGTFSITNFGSYGSLFGTPVINQPQVAILGVGVVEKAPLVIDDAIAIRSVSLMGLTFDHRLIDGALADQFMQKVKGVLEELVRGGPLGGNHATRRISWPLPRGGLYSPRFRRCRRPPAISSSAWQLLSPQLPPRTGHRHDQAVERATSASRRCTCSTRARRKSWPPAARSSRMRA